MANNCSQQNITTCDVPTSVNFDTFTDYYSIILMETARREGLRLNPYPDPSNKFFNIGFGHKLKYHRSIDLDEAIEILIKDFDKSIDYARAYLPNASSEKHLVLASIIFNCGAGRVKDTTLLERMRNNEPIDDVIVQWCKYKRNGVYRTSTNLLKSRKVELSIYNKEPMENIVENIIINFSKRYNDGEDILKKIVYAARR